MISCLPSVEQENEAQRQLEEAKKLLSAFLVCRPDHGTLEKKQIIKSDPASMIQQRAESKAVLTNFLLVRPGPKSLHERNILSENGLQEGLSSIVGIQYVPKKVELLKDIRATSIHCGWGHTAVLDGTICFLRLL